MNESSIANAARSLDDPVAQQKFIQLACDNDLEAINRVQQILNRESASKSPSGLPVDQLAETRSQALESERLGERIGPYRLLEQLGEGGMGTVYVFAEQDKPLRRTVAIKVIKAGMDTKTVIARFEAERQALAVMDHPNIAKVFDAGVVSMTIKEFTPSQLVE